MTSWLSGGSAIITGGASGIGLAVATGLSALGVRIALLDRDEEAGRLAAQNLGASATFIRMDVADGEAWRALAAQAQERLGGIDVAILNAGCGSRVSEPDQVSDEQFRAVVGTNIDGIFYGARAAIPFMRAKGRGAIVVTASLAGLIALPRDPLYAMSKHAAVGFVRALGPQLNSAGITVNAVCPGLTDTPIISARRRAKLAGAGFPLIPASDVAEVIVGCAAGADTGQVLVVQPGRDPVPYRFPRVPGPRVAGREGPVRPPSEFTGADQG